MVEEEPDIDGTVADNDGVGIGKAAAVHVDDELAGGKPRKGAVHAARDLVVRRPFAQHLTYRECKQIAYPQRRRKRKRSRAGRSDGVEVERHLDADHPPVIFCRVEELPADWDK